MSEERKFSFLYIQIVEDENDMIGHIAYSLYKTEKINFIKTFKENHQNKLPTEAELDLFHIASKGHIPALRIQAEQLLSNFTGIALNESIAEIETKLLVEQKKSLTEIILPIIPQKAKGPWDGFFMAVLVKGTQTLVVAIIIFLVIFGASSKNDFWSAVRKMLPETHEIKNNKPMDSIVKQNKPIKGD